MSNTRPSIMVEPLGRDEQGNPVLPQTPQGAGSPQPTTLEDLRIPDGVEVDPKFKGKSVADLIQMVQNGDRKIGELGNEVGTWRRIVSDIGGQPAAAPQASNQPEPETPLELTSDDLLDNPVGAISSVVERSLSKALQPLEDQLARANRATEVIQLRNDHPEMADLMNDPAFNAWAVSSPGRLSDAQAASQGDPSAARRLLEAWSDRNELVAALQQEQANKATQEGQAPQGPQAPVPQGKPQGMEGAQQAVTERGGQGGPPPGNLLTADQVMDTMINNPEVYKSPGYQQKVAESARAGALKLAPDSGHFVR